MWAHGIGRRDESQWREALVLHTLFELQVDLAAHEVNEDLQVVLWLDARGQGSSVSTTHVITLAPPFPPVKNFVTVIFLLAYSYFKTCRLTCCTPSPSLSFADPECQSSSWLVSSESHYDPWPEIKSQWSRFCCSSPEQTPLALTVHEGGLSLCDGVVVQHPQVNSILNMTFVTRWSWLCVSLSPPPVSPVIILLLTVLLVKEVQLTLGNTALIRPREVVTRQLVLVAPEETREWHIDEGCGTTNIEDCLHCTSLSQKVAIPVFMQPSTSAVCLCSLLHWICFCKVSAKVAVLKVVPVFIHSGKKRNVRHSKEGLFWITHTFLQINRIEFSEKKIIINHSSIKSS